MSITAPAPRLATNTLGIAVRVVVAIVTLLGANVIGTAVLAAAAAVIGGHRLNRSNLGLALFIASNAVVCATVALAVWAWCAYVERRSLRSTGWLWTRTSAVWLLAGTTVSALLVATVSIFLPAAESASATGRSSASIGFVVAATLSQAFLMQGAPEELLFRGWLLTSMRDRPVLAIVVTTLSFTAIHLISNGGQQSAADHLAYLALPFGFAVLAVGTLLWTQSLWAAVGVHGGFHVGTAIAGSRLGDEASSWLAVGGTLAIVGAVLIVTALRTGRQIDPHR